MYGETLVLDHSFQPVKRTSWQDAMVAWANGRVEIIAHYTDKLIHEGLGLFMPAVVRFVRKARNKRKKQVRFSRHNVYLRDKGTCQYCSKRVAFDDFQYEHVVPKNQGGKTCWENIVVSCGACNQKKGGKTPQQARMRLVTVPVRPKKLPYTVSRHLVYNPDIMPEDWQPYLPTRDSVASYAYWHGELESE